VDQAKKVAAEADHKQLESLMEELRQAIDKSQALKPFKDQLLLDITPEGLRIQIVDDKNRPMFDLGSAKLKDYTQAILKELAGYLDSVPNHITLSGHTDTTPYVAQNGYTNWDLSADRANAARRALEAGGLNPDKISRVVGLSSSVLFDKTNTRNPINRRISIIVMTRQAEESALKTDDSPDTLSPTPTPSTPPAAVPAPETKADAPAAAAPAATVPAVGGGTSAPALASHS
jgi:chemotaxis protein MotB